MRHLKTAVTVVGTVTVLVLAGNTIALAATGQGFLLGRTNTANTVTILTRTTSGTALSIHSASSANAPLAVNGTGKVAHLNADKLDGLDSAALMTKPYVVTEVVPLPVAGLTLTAPVPVGTYLVSYSVNLVASPSVDLAQVRCGVVDDHTGFQTITADSFQASGGATEVSLSGAGLARKTISSGTISLSCTAAHPFTAGTSVDPVQFVLTPVNGVIASTVQ
jgi:hypothetical protein